MLNPPFPLNSDLKLDSILLTSDGHMKVVSHGQSVDQETSSFCSGPGFVAQEVRKMLHYYISKITRLTIALFILTDPAGTTLRSCRRLVGLWRVDVRDV